MTKVRGIDTIQGLVGNPPKTIEVPYNVVYDAEINRQRWNNIYLAMIPYCFKCKEPLVWHIGGADRVLFHCPKCKRRWVKSKNWRRDHERKLRTRV